MSFLPDLTLLRLAMLTLAGRYFWVLPLLPLLWLVVVGTVFWLDGEIIAPEEAQGVLLAVPMTALAVFMGIRIIGGEIDDHSLEIAYTVPGGCERLWYAKLFAAVAVLLCSEVLLGLSVYAFFTPYPLAALYNALQASCFYLILALAFATLFRSEAAGAMATVLVLGLNGLITDFGDNQIRISPDGCRPNRTFRLDAAKPHRHAAGDGRHLESGFYAGQSAGTDVEWIRGRAYG